MLHWSPKPSSPNPDPVPWEVSYFPWKDCNWKSSRYEECPLQQKWESEMLEHSALGSCTKLIITANLCCCLVCRGKDEIAKLISRQRKGSSQQCLRLKWNSAFAWATEQSSRDGWKLWLQACSSPSLYKCACRDQCAQHWVQRLNAALSPLAPDWRLTQTTHHLQRHSTDPIVWERQAYPKPSVTSQMFSYIRKKKQQKTKQDQGYSICVKFISTASACIPFES